MGIAQGSILSPDFFGLKINEIVKIVLKGSEASLLVDDCALCIRAKTLPHAQRLMQLCVNSVQDESPSVDSTYPPPTQSVCTFVINVNNMPNLPSCLTKIPQK